MYSDDSINNLKREYRVFVSGSDQIWNPNAVRNLYLQTFVSEPYRKFLMRQVLAAIVSQIMKLI